jgi:hypothetical protein
MIIFRSIKGFQNEQFEKQQIIINKKETIKNDYLLKGG